MFISAPCRVIAPLGTSTSSNHTHLSTETVQRTSLTLKSIDDIQARHRLPLRVLSVGDRVTDDAFEESLEDAAGFFVDHCDACALVTTLRYGEEVW